MTRRRPRRAAASGAAAAAVLLTLAFAARAEPTLEPSADCAPAFADPARTETICVARAADRDARPRRDRDICRAIAHYAAREGLPPDFFARLIWRESLFEPNAISPAGAQGVAQFMPETARLRGLSDSFNPAEALAASATYLAELRAEFGNLGLAAAAYNAGEGAIWSVLAGARTAPAETRAYVRAITGVALDDWRDRAPRPEIDYALASADAAPQSFEDACVTLAATSRAAPMAPVGAWRPYGGLVAAHRRQETAADMYDRARAARPSAFPDRPPLILQRRLPGRGPRPLFAAMVGFDSRADAAAFCLTLSSAGGACVVVKN